MRAPVHARVSPGTTPAPGPEKSFILSRKGHPGRSRTESLLVIKIFMGVLKKQITTKCPWNLIRYSQHQRA